MQEQQLQPQQGAEMQAAAPPQNPVAISLRTAFEKASANIPMMQKSVEAACLHLSKIQAIATDEEDIFANTLLVKVRTTFEKVETQRKEITDPLDAIKKMAMEFEKRISTDSKATGSEYVRVKSLRDGYAQKKADDAAAAKAEALKEQQSKDEIARIRAEFGRSVINGVAALTQQVANTFSSVYISLTLETVATFEAMIGRTPALKPEIYAGWFNIGYNSQLVAPEVFNGLVLEAKNTYSIYNCATDFVGKVNAIVEDYKAKLPARKQDLQQLADLAKSDADAAVAAKAAADKKIADDAAAQSAQIQNEAALAADTITAQEESDKADNAFDAQAAVQEIEDPAGRVQRTAILNVPEEEIVVVISKLFYQCFVNPKYKGIYKRDRSKNIKLNEKGEPELVDWLQEMLDFHANNGSQPIEGVVVKELAKSTTKK